MTTPPYVTWKHPADCRLSAMTAAAYLLQSSTNILLHIGRRSKQENVGRLPQEGDDTEKDHGGDKEGADGVGDVPAQVLNEEGGDDHAHTAQGVRQHVQEHSCNTTHMHM